MNSNNTCGLVRELSFADKIRIKLFPPNYCDLPKAPSTHLDVLTVNCVGELSFLDRVRILISGRVCVECKTVTENYVGATVAESTMYALPPKWLAGGGN